MKGKKAIAVLLCSGLALSVVACVSEPDTSSTKESETSIETTTEDTSEITTLTETETTETTEVTTTSEEETTETTVLETEIVHETIIESSDPDKPHFKYGAIFPMKYYKIPKVDMTISMDDLKSFEDKTSTNIYKDESELTEGPTAYYYGYTDLIILYPGSEKISEGAILLTNVRCVLDTSIETDDSTGDSGHVWRIDALEPCEDALKYFCSKKGIKEEDLGIISDPYITEIYDTYWSSLRYETNWTKVFHQDEEDFY